jgi:outer membrane lipoprotein SlyB
MANELAGVLAEQGAWGAVRVVPDGQQFTDLLVNGRILHSDGEKLALAITVEDARGVIWIEKEYEAITSRYAYTPGSRLPGDPFLGLYREIANDMLRVFRALTPSQRITIRRIAELRFARSFSEDAFADYLQEDEDGIVTLLRLPAEDDPMLERVRNIRQRNYVFVDTLQGHYSGFSDDMYTPYQEWRKLSYDEIVALRELKRQANAQMIAGGAALIAGIAARGSGDSTTRAAGMVGVISGGYLLKGGLEKRAESNIHELAIEEIGQSLEAEITPRVIELEDRTVRLTGSVQDQYDQFREILADIYAAEMGTLSGDLQIGVEEAPSSAGDSGQ